MGAGTYCGPETANREDAAHFGGRSTWTDKAGSVEGSLRIRFLHPTRDELQPERWNLRRKQVFAIAEDGEIRHKGPEEFASPEPRL